MTRVEVRNRLLAGETLDSILSGGWRSGQECTIFKVSIEEYDAAGPDDIVYVPDLDLNELAVDDDLSVDIEGIFDLLGDCYTKDDFIKECDGNEKMARELFVYVDWQHPSSAYPEVAADYEDEEEKQ